MILAQCGRIQRIQRIRQHTNALTELAANDRSGRHGSEVTRSDAGFAGQGLADACRLLAGQFVARNDTDGLGKLFDRALEQSCRHDDLVHFVVFIDVPVRLCDSGVKAQATEKGHQRRCAVDRRSHFRSADCGLLSTSIRTRLNGRSAAIDSRSKCYNITM